MPYTYNDPDADVMKALNRTIDAVNGDNSNEYVYKDPDTDILHKIDELTEAVENSGGGGGGTTVVANPDGEATDELEKIQVGSTIYSIPVYEEGDIQTITLSSSSWNSTTHLITVSVTGVTTTSNQEIFGLAATSDANIANNKALQAANIMDAGQASGTITLYAENVPSTDLQIRVIVR